MSKVSELPELTLNEYELIEKQVRQDLWKSALEAAGQTRLAGEALATFLHRSVGTYVTPQQVDVFLETKAGAEYALGLAAKRAGVVIEDEVQGMSIYELAAEAKRVTFRLGRFDKPVGTAGADGGTAE